MPSNGSVAPIATGRAVARRTIEALRTFRPDVLHLHEPLSPGPNHAALVGTTIPAVGTFHSARAGRNGWYETFRPGLKPMMRRLAVSTAVSEEAKRQVTQTFGGECEILPNGVDVPSARHRPGDAVGGAGDRVRRPPRAAQGPRGAARRVRRPRARRRPLGHRRRPRPRRAARAAACRGSSGSGGSPRRRSRPACAARPSRASRRSTASRSGWCCSRRWRPGRRVGGLRHRRLPHRLPGRPRGAAGPAGRRRRAARRRCGRCSTIPVGGPRWWPRARRRADEFSMAHLAERFLPLYERAIAAPRAPSAETKRSRARRAGRRSGVDHQAETTRR